MEKPPQQAQFVIVPAFTHVWQKDLVKVACESPCECCTFTLCPWCAAYDQRLRLLAFTGEPYSCCQQDSHPSAGDCCSKPNYPPPRVLPAVWPPTPEHMPEVLKEFNWKAVRHTTERACLRTSPSEKWRIMRNRSVWRQVGPESCTRRSGTHKFPSFFFCFVFVVFRAVLKAMEAACCLGCAVGSTRRLMSYKWGVQNSSCDDSCICCVLILLFPLRFTHLRHCVRSLAIYSLLGCMQTQQEIEFRFEEQKRKNLKDLGSAPEAVTMMSPVASTAVVYAQPGQQQSQQQVYPHQHVYVQQSPQSGAVYPMSPSGAPQQQQQQLQPAYSPQQPPPQYQQSYPPQQQHNYPPQGQYQPGVQQQYAPQQQAMRG
jgi:hypothetical protein